jgi:hypothetical protein
MVMDGCGKVCEVRWGPEQSLTETNQDFCWLPAGPSRTHPERGGFSEKTGPLRKCGDWYDNYWQLVCTRCLQKAGILW